MRFHQVSLHHPQDYQFTVDGCHPKSKNKEIWDKVRARAAVTTDPGEDTTDLGKQIAKLMAALTRTGQGSSPTSAPNSPRERERGHGRRWSGRDTPGCPSPYNGWTSLGQTILDCNIPTSCETGTTISRN